MFCNNCGCELKEDAKFCIKCGKSVNNNVAQTQIIEKSEKLLRKKSVKRLVIALLILLFVVIGVWKVIPFIKQVRFLKLGKEAIEQQNYTQAYVSFGQALLLVPDSKFVTNEIIDTGNQYIEDGLFQGAVYCFDVILAVDNSNQEAFDGKIANYMAWAEHEYNRGKLNKSIELYENVIQLKPDAEEVYIKIADIYIESNEVIKSIKILDKGLEKCTDNENLEEHRTSIVENAVITCKKSYDKNNQLYSKAVYEYDEEGALLKETLYNPNEINYIMEYGYDEYGNAVTCRTYIAITDAWSQSNKIYDDKGNLIKEESYDESGMLRYYALHNYDSQNNEVSMVRYGYDGIVWSRENYKYDEESKLLEVNHYGYGNEFGYVEIYEYQNEGNTVICTRYDQAGGSFISRMINEYDENGNLMKYTYEDGKTSVHEYSYNVLGDVIKEITTYTDDGAGIKDVSETSYEYQYNYLVN